MPNWVATVVEFSGEDKDIQAVLKEISSEDSKFDFNKLIPMPASLEIESSTKSSLAYTYYYVKKFNRLPGRKHSYYQDKSEVIERVEKDINMSSQEMLDMGKTLYENIEKYSTRYDWCYNNWGTKWNACSVNVCDNMLYFSTAWSFAAPVMKKLAEICAKHNVGFEGEWSDEDMGRNTGYFGTMGGENFYYDYYGDCSHNAYAAYVRCNRESDCLGIDKDGNYYRYECDESCPNYKECMG